MASINKLTCVMIEDPTNDGDIRVAPLQVGSDLEQPELTVTNDLVGVTVTDSEYNDQVAVMTFGIIRDCPEQNGELWSIGMQLWAKQTDGSATSSRPLGPLRQIFIGTVISGNETDLHDISVDVRIIEGVGELNGVKREVPEDRDVLVYRTDEDVWEPRQLWKSVDAVTTYSVDQHDYLVRCDASGGAFTVTLPLAVESTGMVVHIKKIDDSPYFVTIDGNGSEEIDGELTFDLELQGESLMLQCDGVSWAVI